MNKDIYCEVLNGVQYVFAIAQENEILQTLQIGLSILSTLIILISRVVSWYKSVKADGKITDEEIKEIAEEIEKAGKELTKK